VILSSLNSLNTSQEWNNTGSMLTSVHVMGAAVDNEEVSKSNEDIINDQTNNGQGIKAAYGQAIENTVIRFYNLYNPEDDVLENDPSELPQPVYYPSYEYDLALGQSRAQANISQPDNYRDINVREEIAFIDDADGDGLCDLTIPFTLLCTIKRQGDNHFG